MTTEQFLVTALLLLALSPIVSMADHATFGSSTASQQPQPERIPERYFKLAVDSNPDGATVTFSSLTGERALTTDDSIDLARGIWSYSIAKTGFASFRGTLDLRQRRDGERSGTLECDLGQVESSCKGP